MIKNKADFIMGIGYVYHDDKGRRYVFDTKHEMNKFIQELIKWQRDQIAGNPLEPSTTTYT